MNKSFKNKAEQVNQPSSSNQQKQRQREITLDRGEQYLVLENSFGFPAQFSGTTHNLRAKSTTSKSQEKYAPVKWDGRNKYRTSESGIFGEYVPHGKGTITDRYGNKSEVHFKNGIEGRVVEKKNNLSCLPCISPIRKTHEYSQSHIGATRTAQKEFQKYEFGVFLEKKKKEEEDIKVLASRYKYQDERTNSKRQGSAIAENRGRPLVSVKSPFQRQNSFEKIPSSLIPGSNNKNVTENIVGTATPFFQSPGQVTESSLYNAGVGGTDDRIMEENFTAAGNTYLTTHINNPLHTTASLQVYRGNFQSQLLVMNSSVDGDNSPKNTSQLDRYTNETQVKKGGQSFNML